MDRSESDKCNDVGQEGRTQPKKHIPVRLVYFLFINKKLKTLNIKLIILFKISTHIFPEKPEKEDCQNEEEGTVKRTSKAEKRNEETRRSQNPLWVQKHFDISITQNKLT